MPPTHIVADDHDDVWSAAGTIGGFFGPLLSREEVVGETENDQRELCPDSRTPESPI